MHSAEPLQFFKFGSGDPLHTLPKTTQVEYLKVYLEDLDVASVMVEPSYFDRDYLSEFACFYSTSARGYKNICMRIHFFSIPDLKHEDIEKAASGDPDSQKRLQDGYLGFAIIRPIGGSPLGRTVLKLYADKHPNQRITAVRTYTCHVAGFELEIDGLAWQQQDTGVSACATIALWSALQSLAFDEFHAIPTTAEITEAAHLTASLGSRVFPAAGGLTIYQLREAIKELGLAPLVHQGELKDSRFSREKFLSSLASYLRSGYPVIIIGHIKGSGMHAVCCVGFREAVGSPSTGTGVTLQDADAAHIYVHDDNLGPSVRCKVIENRVGVMPGGQTYVSFKPEAPTIQYGTKPRTNDPTNWYPEIIPTSMIVAVHNELRTSPDALHKAGMKKAFKFEEQLNKLLVHTKKPAQKVNISTRFMSMVDYVQYELGRNFSAGSTVLSSARLTLWEKLPPMSRHLGIVRLGIGSDILVDFLYDTTDNDKNHPVFGSVVFDPDAEQIVTFMKERLGHQCGEIVKAY